MQSLRWLCEYDFARHALITGVAVGTLCSLLSVVVVLKRMTFIGQGISHAGFGGVGTAVFLGLSGFSRDGVVFLFCLASALMIGAMSRRKRVESDSAIGILLVAAMAWGVLMENASVMLRDGHWLWYTRWVGPRAVRPSYEQLLFGSLLNVSENGMWLAVGITVAVLLVCVVFFKEILFFTFDERVSQVFGVPTRVIHYLLLVMLSITIVSSLRLIGFVLVSALLVIPGATGMMLSRRLGWVFFWSWVVGTIGTTGGLMVSLESGYFSSGPCIVMALCVVFSMVYVVRATMSWKGR
jgi:iron/zinc/copper transport system permease protein